MMKKLLCVLAAFLMLCTVALAETDLELGGFTASTLTGDTFVLTDHAGEVVFMNFWATWCGPCTFELPAIDHLSTEYADAEDVTIVTINCGEDPDLLQSFMDYYGYGFTTVLDSTYDIGNNYGVASIPMTILFDKTGSIGNVFVGVNTSLGLDGVYQYYHDAIEELR